MVACGRRDQDKRVRIEKDYAMTSPPSSSLAVRRSAAMGSAWAPFRYRIFALVWVATVISNVGGWMYSAAAGWLMTNLTSDPLMVSLVQVANSLPVLIFAFPAGALADVVDKRKFLIGAETSIALLSTLFAFLVWRGLVGPQTLLLFVFVIGAVGALTAAPWQAVVPELVPKEHLAPAVALNSLGRQCQPRGRVGPGWRADRSSGDLRPVLGEWREQCGSDRGAAMVVSRAAFGGSPTRRTLGLGHAYRVSACLPQPTDARNDDSSDGVFHVRKRLLGVCFHL